MTKQRPETKFEVFFYGILLSPLGFRAIIDVIIAAAAYWNGYYFIATFFAAVAWTALAARATEMDIGKLRDEVDEEIDRLWDRISEITGQQESGRYHHWGF